MGSSSVIRVSPFGQRLREWRRRRGMTQLELAYAAESTPRYVSFLETGRARPGRDVVVRLAAALRLLPRERNGLLVAAGLAAEHSEHALDDAEMEPVRRVISHLLRHHEPFPAWCLRRGFRLLEANQAAERLFPGMTALSPEQMVDFSFGPDSPMRSVVDNWEEVTHAALEVLQREVLVGHHRELESLLERATRHMRGRTPPRPSAVPVVCPVFRFGDTTLRTISTVMRFDAASDVTASELKVELAFPADEASERFLRSLADSA